MSYPVVFSAFPKGNRRVLGFATIISNSTILKTAIVFGLIWTGSIRLVNAEEVEPQERALKGVDVDGKPHRFAESSDCRAVVVTFLSTHCPISNGTLPTLAKIAATYVNNGIEFYGVVSDPSATREDVAAHRDEYRIPFPVLFAGGPGCLQPGSAQPMRGHVSSNPPNSAVHHRFDPRSSHLAKRHLQSMEAATGEYE